MYKSTQLGEIMETTCDACDSRFRITEQQLRQAYGKVCCGECGQIFNALAGLKNYEGELPEDYQKLQLEQDLQELADERTLPVTEFDFDHYSVERTQPNEPISLEQAMYGDRQRRSFFNAPLIWFIGILLLVAIGFAQAIYYQRYQLVDDPRFQQQVITLCEYLPCEDSQFSSTEQIRLIERNVFTHPITDNALMVTGSFINQAPFTQRLPDMLISLFDIQGKLIANRLFKPTDYLLEDRNRRTMNPEQPVQFRLELIDPGTNALTYEFEFF